MVDLLTIPFKTIPDQLPVMMWKSVKFWSIFTIWYGFLDKLRSMMWRLTIFSFWQIYWRYICSYILSYRYVILSTKISEIINGDTVMYLYWEYENQQFKNELVLRYFREKMHKFASWLFLILKICLGWVGGILSSYVEELFLPKLSL